MPETTDNYHRIPVEDILDTDSVITKTLSAAEGIKALYSTNRKLILTYLFDTSKWTMAKARAWVRDHAKGMVDVAESTAPAAGLEFKTLPFALEGVATKQNGDRIIRGFASTPDVDEGNDSMNPMGVRIPRNKVRFLYNHNPNNLPIGPVLGVWPKKEGVAFEAKVSKTFFGDAIWTLAEDGALDELSIGFKADPSGVEYDTDMVPGKKVRRVNKWDLFEVSVVPLAMNANATFDAALAKALEHDADLETKSGLDVPCELHADAPVDYEAICRKMLDVLEGISPGATISPNGETDSQSETPNKKSYPFDFDTEADRIIDVVKLFGLFPEETKAGRKISGARLTRLKEAVQTLAEIILEAEPASAADVEGAAEEVAEAAGKSAALTPENYDAFVKMIAAQLRAA